MTIVVAALMAVVCVQGQDRLEVTVPLKGLVAPCCEGPVQQALKKIEVVESVKLRKKGALYGAEIALKRWNSLAMSAIDKALEEANAGMGSSMGTKYEVDDSLPLAQVHFFKTAEAPEEGKLKEALGKLGRLASLWTTPTGFSAAFDGPRQPTLAQVKEAAGVETTDVYLAPSRGRIRLSCVEHPEKVALEPAKCPECKKVMVKVVGSAPVGK
ncbi:MAG: hypothetical protein HYY16_17195 [Planctomycetes bacterium]|nr:hypothetical protein [Planctomycetota bacterium]